MIYFEVNQLGLSENLWLSEFGNDIRQLLRCFTTQLKLAGSIVGLYFSDLEVKR